MVSEILIIILFQYVLHATWLACLSCVMYMAEEHDVSHFLNHFLYNFITVCSL